MFSKKITSGDYCLRNYKFINIKSLISSLNKILQKKIKTKFFIQKQSAKYKINDAAIKNIYTKDDIKNFLLKYLN